MSWIKAADPLALVAIQSGRVGTPSREAGAVASSSLDTSQRAVKIGEPVPIVFGRWRNGAGGVFVSPGATEARFQNDVNNQVTAFYHLVISEGVIDDIQVRDVFQRSCRVGYHTQTYSRRAGQWAPGNYVVQRDGYDKPECPYHCGSVGTYPGMSTLSFAVTVPDGSDRWDRQVHLFIRGGMHVTRLYDSTTGPSDNFADLVYWMLSNSRRVPSSLIDSAALTSAATFLEVNGFTCNVWLTESRNYADLISEWSPYFLLGESNQNGKKGLRPLLPTTAGAINTGVIDWEYIFTEDTILPDTLEIEYTSLADRLPFVAQITWRQQLSDDVGIVRTAEVRYKGTAITGPYEAHDLSAFCTKESHAVKVGAYMLAKRVHVTHMIRFSARPQAHNRSLTVGDIVRVKLARKASIAGTSFHDYLYQIERITKTLAGDVSYECSHFPINAAGQSLIALDVAAATGSGILLTNYRTGDSCDTNSSTDETVPDEAYIEPGDANDPAGELGSSVSINAGGEEVLDGGTGAGGGGGGSGPDDDSENPDDDKDRQPDSPYDSWPEDYPRPGDPDWPPGWPTTPIDPNESGPGIWPIAPSSGLPHTIPEESSVDVVIRHAGTGITANVDNDCKPGAAVEITEFSLTYSGKRVRSVYRWREYDGIACSGWTNDKCGIMFQATSPGVFPEPVELSIFNATWNYAGIVEVNSEVEWYRQPT
jgi:hypothetical protein